MSLIPPPAVSLERFSLDGQTTCVCSCGWANVCPTSGDAKVEAELHSIRCPQFRTWAHEAIDNLGFTIGYYIPAQVLELLHVLVDQPAAATQIMPWLFGLEERIDA